MNYFEWVINLIQLFYDLKNYADVGGSYLPCPLVAADNTILDL